MSDDDDGSDVDTGIRMRDLRTALLKSGFVQGNSNIGLQTASGEPANIKRHVQLSVTADIVSQAKSTNVEEVKEEIVLAIMSPSFAQEPTLQDASLSTETSSSTTQQDLPRNTIEMLMEQNNVLKSISDVFETNGATLVEIRRGLIVFVLQISSQPNLDAFWNSYKDGSLQSHLQSILITRDREQKAGCSLFLQLHIDEMDYPRGLQCFSEQELRLVLVGRTGSGKSTTGNHILLKYKKNQRPFATAIGGSSMTEQCSFSKNEVFGRPVVVIDTPGLFDTSKKNMEVLTELTRFLLLMQPGPHAIVVVMRAGTLTQEIEQTVSLLVRLLKKAIYSYMVVLFTGKDDLEEMPMSLKEYLDTIPMKIKDIVSKCENRCIAFNNKASEEYNIIQVEALLKMIDDMVKANGGNCYESDLQKEIGCLFPKSEVTTEPDAFREAAMKEKPIPGGWFWKAVAAVAASLEWVM